MLALDHDPILRRLAIVVATGALVLAMSSCGGSDKADGPPPKTNIGEPATVDKTTSTTSTTAAIATTVAAPVGLPEATDAAGTLYGSWKADDRPGAARVAEPAAVEGMFATSPGDYRLYNHCNTGEFDAATCLYRGDPGTIQFSMEKRGPNWVVVTAIFSEA